MFCIFFYSNQMTELHVYWQINAVHSQANFIMHPFRFMKLNKDYIMIYIYIYIYIYLKSPIYMDSLIKPVYKVDP